VSREPLGLLARRGWRIDADAIVAVVRPAVRVLGAVLAARAGRARLLEWPVATAAVDIGLLVVLETVDAGVRQGAQIVPCDGAPIGVFAVGVYEVGQHRVGQDARQCGFVGTHFVCTTARGVSPDVARLAEPSVAGRLHHELVESGVDLGDAERAAWRADAVLVGVAAGDREVTSERTHLDTSVVGEEGVLDVHDACAGARRGRRHDGRRELLHVHHARLRGLDGGGAARRSGMFGGGVLATAGGGQSQQEQTARTLHRSPPGILP